MTLASNTTGAELDRSGLTSFDTDGFTLDVRDGMNKLNDAYVAWNWKANGSGVSNTDGSITSTVSANVDAGFSIVSYTGTGATTDQTVGHGLSGHAMTIIKARGSAASGTWRCAHVDLTSNYNLALNTTSAEFDVTASTHGGVGDVSSTSNTFTLKKGTVGTNNVNESGIEYIAYNWQEIEGFSAFGSYTGNGPADGPFVYTGFRPAFVMVKNADVANSWRLWDAERPSYNVTNLYLSPDTSGAEGAINIDVDFTASGFKIRNTNGSINGSGNKIIFMAFAELPAKYSPAR